MERHGFIRDMMDVKVLILYVTARLNSPATIQEIYELCYQDEKLTYFDVCDAVPDLLKSGHLEQVKEGYYAITEKGRENGALTEDSVAYTVRERAKQAVDRFNKESKRSAYVKAEMIPQEDGNYVARMTLDDDRGRLMSLELMAPSQPQAAVISRSFQKNAELIYRLLMEDLLEDENFEE